MPERAIRRSPADCRKDESRQHITVLATALGSDDGRTWCLGPEEAV